MATVHVPKPKSVRNPDRAASSLLLAQVQHLREAEKSLPPSRHSGIFSHAIRTEGEAAQYIRAVTEAIHAAHREAKIERERRRAAREGVITIAAQADETAEGKTPDGKGNKGSGKGRKG